MIEPDAFGARNYDRAMWVLERSRFAELRQHVVGLASGETLEIGVGTGANLPLYRRDVTLTAVDMKPASLREAGRKARRRGGPADQGLACADAQELPFPDASFDSVLGTLVFCSIAKPEAALAEIRRVLRPDGRLILLEHVRGQTAATRKLTDWLHPLWFAIQGMCHLNRETAATVAAAGFTIDFTTTHARGLAQVIHASVATG